jgi:hypothetical protein
MAICRLMVFTFNSSAARNDCLNYLFCNRDDPNKNGSTPMLLASQNIGRGGSGSADAKAQQKEILRLLTEHGATRPMAAQGS